MVALTATTLQVGQVAHIQPFMAPPPGFEHLSPPGLELPGVNEVPAKVVLAAQNDVLAQANASLQAENAKLMQQYMALRLAAENAALAKLVSDKSPISTEPPSDVDDDDDDLVVLSDSDSDFEAEDAEDEDELTPPGEKVDVTDTTVVMRNVPQSFTRQQLMDLLDSEGFHGKYTFLYLPFNFGSGKSLGYAFVNLESDQVRHEFLDHFHGFTAWGTGDEMACSVEKTKDQQGLDENIERYRNSPVMHEMVPDGCKPVILAHGVRVDFPPPTMKIRPPPRRLLAGSLVPRI